MKKRKNTLSVQAQMKVAETQIDRTLSEIIEAIDRYKVSASLEFMQGRDGSPGAIFNKYRIQPKGPHHFDEWIERWMSVLCPGTIEHIVAIRNGTAGNDEYMNLCYNAQSFGYILGYFVGCRTMGASNEDMHLKIQLFKERLLPCVECTLEDKAKRKTS